MKLTDKNIGFIGGGAMADALIGGLIDAGLDPQQIAVAEPDTSRRDAVRDRHGVVTHAGNDAVVTASDIVVIAVKPQIVEPALTALDPSLDGTRPLWISIAAGVTLDALGAPLDAGARIVRAMPNTPALVGEGATAVCGNTATSSDDLAAARALFECVGIAWQAETEDQLDAVTGLSGSGPAYVFLFLEALIAAGENVGLPKSAAERLATQTLYGAAKLARASDLDPAALRGQVSSKGGTTVEGVARLEQGDLRGTVANAVEAATRRSRELGGGS